jgi:hypothetical protein
MSHLRHTVLTVALVSAAIGSWAQAPATGQPANRPAPPVNRPGNADPMAAMDSQIKAMRELHEKLLSAKTPEERNALMAAQMKTMQDGMASMNMMGGSGMGGMQGGKPMPGDMNQRQQMMEKRMEMMQSMMQMMMDRLPPVPAKP